MSRERKHVPNTEQRVPVRSDMGVGVALVVPPELVDAIAAAVAERIVDLQPLAPAADAWIDADEAAAYIGKSKDRVYDLAQSGALRHGRDGRSLLFRRCDLDDYLLGRKD